MSNEELQDLERAENILNAMNISVIEKEGYEADDIIGTLAKKAEKKLIGMYGQNQPDHSDYIVPIGGDGLLLKSLHNLNNLNKERENEVTKIWQFRKGKTWNN